MFTLWLFALPAAAQQDGGRSWRDQVDEWVLPGLDDDDETDGGQAEDAYELLEQLASQKLDLNRATRQELEQLPFLSAQQVMDLQEYLFRYGPMQSLGELRMVRSLDYQQLALLPFFVTVESTPYEPPADLFPPLDSLLRHSRQQLTATLRVPFYQRRGDRNGYLGYALRHSLRYELTSGTHLRLGLVAAQDAGEPFFTGRNRWGYDAYSYYVQLRQLGRISSLLAGKYRLSAGMGLVLGQSFQLGKLAVMQSMGRGTTVLRPHTSRAESDYFLGAATTLRLGRTPAPLGSSLHAAPDVQLTLFASHRPIDATLTDGGDARTLITSGYHRTPTEMAKKHNTHLTATGAYLAYQREALRLGATVVATTIDRPLQPLRSTLYRRHWAHGRHFVNMGLHYAYTHHRFALAGETALDGHAALATVSSASLTLTPRLRLLAVQRFYSYRYTTLYGHGFAEGSQMQNESGIYLGAVWNPLPHVQLQGYADYAYFPWARYQVSFSSHATDLLLQATYRRARWSLTARHRSHLRQKDNEAKTAIMAHNDHRERLALACQAGDVLLKTQLDLAYITYKQNDRGWMLSQQAAWQPKARPWQLWVAAGLFHTSSYLSRIYVYERQLPHEFYFPTYYGKGLHLAAQARVNIGSRLRLSARASHTNYFDRPTIGSGLQLISHSHQTDLDVQLSWKF